MFFKKATIEHEYVCSLPLLSWRENTEEFKQKVKIWSIAAEEQQPAGLWPRSPAASTLQPLLQSRGLPGSGVPKHLLLLDRILIESCHTCHLSLRMITHLKGSFAGDTPRTFLARKCPSFYSFILFFFRRRQLIVLVNLDVNARDELDTCKKWRIICTFSCRNVWLRLCC